ncbi:MYND-type domain-containing protein [Mycena indigotica]|uniref:MYND-type domain-containing protein n=1 Tax=Mycena indigotica TaxID=2126181 RepID=A0A8H6TDV6_9AGAR|nr:MYND-type domain-containing protein [Mycena indigotica]KAF7314936.1 MYND-type domain-containing protein [Mycena indigotica]
MHSCLKLSNISRLPAHIRNHAKSAANGSVASMHALRRLYFDSGSQMISPQQLLFLAPVFYRQLNSSTTPELQSLVEMDPRVAKEQIFRVLWSLQGLSYLFCFQPFPNGVIPEIWPRIWTWVTLLDAFWEEMPSFHVQEEQEHTLITILSCILNRKDSEHAFRADLVNNDNIFVVAGSIWRRLALKQDAKPTLSVQIPYFWELSMFCTVIVHIGVHGTKDLKNVFESIASGAGNWRALAHMLVVTVRHVSDSTPEQRYWRTQNTSMGDDLHRSSCFTSLSIFCIMMDLAQTANPTFTEDLRQVGAVGALTTALLRHSRWAQSPVQVDISHELPEFAWGLPSLHLILKSLEPEYNLRYRGAPPTADPSFLFSFLYRLIIKPGTARRWVIEGLNAGLLHVLLFSDDFRLEMPAHWQLEPVDSPNLPNHHELDCQCLRLQHNAELKLRIELDTTEKVRSLLKLTLPAYSYYHSVLVALKRGFDDIDSVGVRLPPGRILQPEFVRLWHALKRHVNGLLGIAGHRKSSPSASTNFRACDNLTCNKIMAKTRFKRCPQCSRSLYCDRTCQRSDWKRFHRVQCQLLKARDYHYRRLFTDADRSFFRALMSSWFYALRYRLSLTLAGYKAAFPAVPMSDICVVFTFMNTTSQPSIRLISTVSSTPGAADIREQFPDVIHRVQQSGGTMQLHVLEVTLGCQTEHQDTLGPEGEAAINNAILVPMPLRLANREYLSRLSMVANPAVRDRLPVGQRYTAIVHHIVDTMGAWVY